MNEMSQPRREYLSKEQTEFIFSDIDNHQFPLELSSYNPSLFKGYKNILIIGNPRSGTTFTGIALSKTLSLKYIDENDFQLRNASLLKKHLDKGDNIVQCPGFTHISHLLADKDTLIVFMVRRWSDIVKSLYRIEGKISNWVYSSTLYDYELYNRKYPGIRTNCIPFQDLEVEKYFKKYIDKKGYALEIPYKMWKYYQRDKIPNWIQLDYESMKSHPMWVDKDKRQNTTRKQISK